VIPFECVDPGCTTQKTEVGTLWNARLTLSLVFCEGCSELPSSLKGVNTLPLFAGFAGLAALLFAFSALWWREGR
jgi:hypothetical protein